MEKLVLIDGHSILSRAFYGVPALNNSSGLYTNAIYGFLNIMFKILDEENANYLAVAFDLPEPTFRHQGFKEYKGTRKPMPEELLAQVPLIKEVLQSMQIPILSLAGYEADDIIGTIAKYYASQDLAVSILSGDRDLLQLADTYIKIRIPKTSKGQTIVKDYYPQDVLEEYQVTPLEFIDVKALMGDTSDNIPGVPSIGEKTATAIIKKYHSIEEAFAKVEEITPKRARENLKTHYDLAEFSKWLATIKTDVPIQVELKNMYLDKIYNKESFAWIRKLEFKSFFKRFEGLEIEDIKEFALDIEIISSKAEAKKIVSQSKIEKELGMGILYGMEALPFEEEKIEVMVGFSICFSQKVYIIGNGMEIGEEDIRGWILDILKYHPSCAILHLKKLLKILGIEKYQNIYDLSIAAYLLNPLKDSYDIDDIARDYLGENIPSYQELIGKKDILESFIEKDNGVFRYLGYQAKVSLQAKPILLKDLEEKGMKDIYLNMEMPLVYVLAKMEERGIGVDAKRLKDYSIELEKEIKEVENQIYQDTGEVFNINSPKQLGIILFEKLHLPDGKKTKTGYSTSADVLEKLAPTYPVVSKILHFRHLSKLNTTYAQGLANYIGEDSRIHGVFHQTVTATGRISSTDPNLQNIPIRTEMGSRIRDIFVPSEGYVFIDADYSQIELRILASMSGDKGLIESYRSSIDIHTTTASHVFHVPLKEVTPELRRNAKAVNFGVVYGISAFGLSEDLSISRKDALEYINNYFKTYPDVKRFLDRNVTMAKEEGYVKTLYGRIRPIPEIKSSNFMQRAFGDRVAMNSPIQGTAADIMKLTMIAVEEALLPYGEKARMVLQVHDELLIEVKEELAEEVKELVVQTMREVADLSVTLEVDANIGYTWLEAK